MLRGERVAENTRLSVAHERRLSRDRDESEQLLAHQRQLIAGLEALPDTSPPRAGRHAAGEAPGPSKFADAPAADGRLPHFSERYAALLRAYVLMGSGSMANEIAETADQLVAASLSPPEALQLHLAAVESLVKGLGNRSARHVMARADLLAIELMTHLAHRSQRTAEGPLTTSQPAEAALLRNVTGTAGIDLTARS